MRRFLPCCLIGLIVVGTVVAMNSLRANDGEKPDLRPQKDDFSEVTDLVNRIEELENRLTKLEGRDPVIRQADSRETSNVDGSVPLPPEMTSSDEEDDEDISQKTNGQSWRFRLLGRGYRNGRASNRSNHVGDQRTGTGWSVSKDGI